MKPQTNFVISPPPVLPRHTASRARCRSLSLASARVVTKHAHIQRRAPEKVAAAQKERMTNERCQKRWGLFTNHSVPFSDRPDLVGLHRMDRSGIRAADWKRNKQSGHC